MFAHEMGAQAPTMSRFSTSTDSIDMPPVRRNSSPQRASAPSATETGEIRPTPVDVESRELTCERTPPSSGGLPMPLARSKLEQLPQTMLAYRVGDLLEFDERSDLGEASKTTRAAMAQGTSNPLYATLHAQQAAYRMGSVTRAAVERARNDVKADRASREHAERARAAYAAARKNWASTVQRCFEAKPRDVMQINFAADLASELGRTDLAVTVLRWGLAQFPNDRLMRLKLAEVLLQVRPLAPDSTDDALLEARIVKEINPKDSRPRVIIAKALLLRAGELIRRGELAGAHSAHQAALDELRQEPAVNDPLILAMVEHSLGNEAESSAAIKTYLDGRRGRDVEARLAEVYAWRGELVLAHECLEKILARNIHDHGLCQVAHSRFMASMLGDSRWMSLLSRMNRAPDQLAAIPLEIRLPDAGQASA